MRCIIARVPYTDKMRFRRENVIVYAIRIMLIGAVIVALFTSRWSTAFVSSGALVLSFLPEIFEEQFQLKLPVSFLSGIVVFVFATIFLGEVFDFYERYWWWDVLLHAGSAAGFGLAGFLFVFMLFEGDRYAAPPLAIAFIAFCVSVTIGVSWEVFEFGMDQIFGLNMQKSGLIDTMWDLIVDIVGASLGGWAGFFYLKGREIGGLSAMIDEFVRLNRRLFRRHRRDK